MVKRVKISQNEEDGVVEGEVSEGDMNPTLLRTAEMNAKGLRCRNVRIYPGAAPVRWRESGGNVEDGSEQGPRPNASYYTSSGSHVPFHTFTNTLRTQ